MPRTPGEERGAHTAVPWPRRAVVHLEAIKGVGSARRRVALAGGQALFFIIVLAGPFTPHSFSTRVHT